MSGPFQFTGDNVQVHRSGPASARVSVPGSKSLTNRLLLLAGLAEGESQLTGALQSDDTHYMRLAMQALGVKVQTSGQTWRVLNPPSWKQPLEPLFIGNAGTAMRFLTPALAVQPFVSEIGGNDRMAVRPIGDLVMGLRQLGARIEYLGKEGCPPLRIQGPLTGGRIKIRGDASSQYLSGLLMALPIMETPPEIEIDGPLVSKTYVEMTLDCLAKFGVEWQVLDDFSKFRLGGNQKLRGVSLQIEPDASTASYWFALPFLVGGSVTVTGVPAKSHQGDFGLLDILKRMGGDVRFEDGAVRLADTELNGIDVDMNTMSDVAPTLAVIATRAKSATTIRNIANMRIKECDRIETLQTAFDALGLRMTSGPDWMRIEPGACEKYAVLNPEEDHRMAMVFALLGLAYGNLSISDPGCVAKTYPRFWEEIASAL